MLTKRKVVISCFSCS